MKSDRFEREKTEDVEGYRPRVIVKFHDYIELPYEDGVEKYFKEFKIGPWEEFEDAFPGVIFRRLFTALSPEEIRELVDKAAELDSKYVPPNFFTYFAAECPPGVDPDKLVLTLSSWQTVKKAYFDPPGSEPSVNPADDPRSGNQGYLDPAPDGIDARFAWTVVGGDGAGVSVIDLERGWTFNHEDLTAHGATLLHGTIRNGSRAHGTAVLGEICSVDNTVGCIGIGPNLASVNAVSYWGSNRPNAIMSAIANLSFGDLLLLEAQLSIPSWPMMPIEVLDAEFDAIRLATALGIVVIEAAGNGSNDLDTYVDGSGNAIFNRASADFRDSGAIMVGAVSSTSPHTRMGFSNFGSRIDCYAWGENVDTCYSNSTGSTTMYTGTFNGTSSASPIITGAAMIVQSIAETSLGYRFNPLQLRTILSDPANGTQSNNPATDRIGVMPDLRGIINNNVINLAPDIYIRDYVGDAGDPHTGAISASPDIILRPTTVVNPQGTFGEGSGTENSNTLGYEAEEGTDNYIYVRVRNRGGSTATNVVARVFWSPVASLITPNLWTLIGSVTITSVPTGDLLTVSNAITWPATDIPGEGHYCFVGLIGNLEDPAPSSTDFLNWNNFRLFIRENNNVTWRNFNVVPNEPDPEADPADFVGLPFIAPGTPEKGRRMRLETVARLPKGSKAFLEVPLYLIDAMQEKSPFLKREKRRHRAWIPINPYGRKILGEALFPAKSKTKLRLLIQIPKEERGNEYEVYVRQIFEEEEVGRVTWRLTPLEKIKQRREEYEKEMKQQREGRGGMRK